MDILDDTPSINTNIQCGVKESFNIELNKGRLSSPEQFFMSRYSAREFKEETIDPEIVLRVLRLASKTPSVCNRPSYFVYHLDSREQIQKSPSLQNGNRGFGEKIFNLFIIASDLRAFDSKIERYQHWIDGGMYAMTVSWALHSLGLGSCCLNWSQGPANDIKTRNILPIAPQHTIIMLMAFGEPAEDLNVCCSPRSPLVDHYANPDKS